MVAAFTSESLAGFARNTQPILDGLVGGDQGAAALIAVADHAEEQARFLPVQRLKAHLVDDQQGDVEVLAPAQGLRREVSILLHRVEQLVEAEEGDGKAVLDGFDPQRDREMGFADPWRSADQSRLVLPDPGAGGQGLDSALLDGGLKGKVEVGERLAGRQPRQAQGGLDPPLFALRQLDGQELIDETMGRQVLLDRLAEQLGKTLTAILDRLLHHSHVLNIKGRSYRLRDLERAAERTE